MYCTSVKIWGGEQKKFEIGSSCLCFPYFSKLKYIYRERELKHADQ